MMVVSDIFRPHFWYIGNYSSTIPRIRLCTSSALTLIVLAVAAIPIFISKARYLFETHSDNQNHMLVFYSTNIFCLLIMLQCCINGFHEYTICIIAPISMLYVIYLTKYCQFPTSVDLLSNMTPCVTLHLCILVICIDSLIPTMMDEKCIKCVNIWLFITIITCKSPSISQQN